VSSAELRGEVDHDLGDRGAFEAMVREQEPALRAIAMNLCRDPHVANDIVQDTFERAFKGRAGKPPGAPPRSWLVTILRNRFIDFWRRSWRARDAEGQIQHEDQPRDADPTPGWASITPEQLEAAVDSLDEEFRSVYRLHAEGRSYQEIANLLSIPRPTVGTRLLRARRKLRELLLPHVAQPEDAP
jgi:RNA polymerase sigma-70 factor (ECF subfamily)